MTEAVVDHLEVVEIEEEHRRSVPGVTAPVEGDLDLLAEQHPVGQHGQRIVQGLVSQLFLQLGESGEGVLEPSVLEGHRDLAGEGHQDTEILRLEGAHVAEAVGDQEGADDLVGVGEGCRDGVLDDAVGGRLDGFGQQHAASGGDHLLPDRVLGVELGGLHDLPSVAGPD